MSLADLRDRIKDTPISAVIENYIPLHKKGSQLLGLCPFHNDSKPSLNVNDKKGMFMCFACNTGGDAITFVQKFKNLEFVDALKDISEKMGININDYLEQKEVDPQVAMARKILSKSIQIYRKIAEHKKPKEFQQFVQNRGLTPEILSTFGIGYAPAGNTISEYLQSIPNSKDRKFALDVALKIHMIREDKNRAGHYYDVFRSRVMFPVWDSIGHPVGFGGRAVLEEQKAKYYNSQESFHFIKKNILYGLNISKRFIREKNAVILVEGYMDLIALYQAGFQNVVAVMGVAMSDRAISSLKGLTSNFYLALDSDQAGGQAMERINKLCLENKILPKKIELAPHKDPDEFIKNLGSLELTKRLEQAKPFTDLQLESLLPSSPPELFDRKLQILDKASEVLAPLESDMLATERIISFARKLGLKSEDSQILERYKSISKGHSKPAPLPVEKPEIVVPKRSDASLSKCERVFLLELVQHPECLNHTGFMEILDYVDNSEVQRFAKRLRELYFEIDESEYSGLVLNLVDVEGYSLDIKEVVGASIYKYQPSELNDKIVARLVFDMKKKLQEQKLKQKKLALKQLQKECQTQETLDSLMKEIFEIEKNLNELKKSKPTS